MPVLALRGHSLVGLDLVTGQDVRSPLDLSGFDGVIHLAAVSRVAVAEANPDACWSTNVGGTENVIRAARAAPRAPWILFASSREVYGQPAVLPVDEEAPLCPLNVYGRAKVAGEACMHDAPGPTAIVRLSNVYGRTTDHADRVVPAFARAAALGTPLRVDGRDNGFDFTHIDDVTRALASIVDRLQAQESLPPLQLVTGQETPLGALAALAREHGAGEICDAPPRTYDVSRFCGLGARAAARLDWRPEIGVREGFAALVGAFSETLGGQTAVAPERPPLGRTAAPGDLS
jgi:nucleoside-diphosphate-sugar epimerase